MSFSLKEEMIYSTEFMIQSSGEVYELHKTTYSMITKGEEDFGVQLIICDDVFVALFFMQLSPDLGFDTEVNSFVVVDPEPFVNVFAPDPTSKASSSGEIMMPEPNQSTHLNEQSGNEPDSHPFDNHYWESS
ncbi:hypothetical protein Tco_1235418 [Tanacetum coccineum]